MLGVLAGAILIFFLLAQATVAQAPTKSNEEIVDESGQYAIQDGAVKPLLAAFASGTKSVVPSIRTRNPSTPQNLSQEDTFTGRHYSKEEVIQLIKDYSAQYAISPDLPLRIAKCESGYNQFAKNRTSTASGVFQYLASTWSATDQGKAGLSVFDADANVKAAVSYIASRGHARPWLASQNCWN